MKKWLCVLCVMLCLALLGGCGTAEKKLELSYEVEKTEFSPGDTASFATQLKNLGSNITYDGYIHYSAYLFTQTEEGEYRISLSGKKFTLAEDLGIDNVMVVKVEGTASFKRGETCGVDLDFSIPEDAPAGQYSLYLSFEWAEQTFENVITVK